MSASASAASTAAAASAQPHLNGVVKPTIPVVKGDDLFQSMVSAAMKKKEVIAPAEDSDVEVVDAPKKAKTAAASADAPKKAGRGRPKKADNKEEEGKGKDEKKKAEPKKRKAASASEDTKSPKKEAETKEAKLIKFETMRADTVKALNGIIREHLMKLHSVNSAQAKWAPIEVKPLKNNIGGIRQYQCVAYTDRLCFKVKDALTAPFASIKEVPGFGTIGTCKKMCTGLMDKFVADTELGVLFYFGVETGTDGKTEELFCDIAMMTLFLNLTPLTFQHYFEQRLGMSLDEANISLKPMREEIRAKDKAERDARPDKPTKGGKGKSKSDEPAVELPIHSEKIIQMLIKAKDCPGCEKPLESGVHDTCRWQVRSKDGKLTTFPKEDAPKEDEEAPKKDEEGPSSKKQKTAPSSASSSSSSSSSSAATAPSSSSSSSSAADAAEAEAESGSPKSDKAEADAEESADADA
jgi:hypothetical protein